MKKMNEGFKLCYTIQKSINYDLALKSTVDIIQRHKTTKNGLANMLAYYFVYV